MTLIKIRPLLLMLLLAVLLAACNTSTIADTTTEETITSEVISCAIKGDVMTVKFTAQADEPVETEISMAVWLSDDNGAGIEQKTLRIHNKKKHSISMQSLWFSESYRVTYYDVILTIGPTTHRFDFREGQIERLRKQDQS